MTATAAPGIASAFIALSILPSSSRRSRLCGAVAVFGPFAERGVAARKVAGGTIAAAVPAAATVSSLRRERPAPVPSSPSAAIAS
jgi:hypothetical protein